MPPYLRRIAEIRDAVVGFVSRQRMSEYLPFVLLGIFFAIFLILFVRHWMARRRPGEGRTARDTLRMAKRLARKGRYMEAGLLYESIHEFKEAADMFFKAEAFFKSGEFFLKEKLYKEAADSLEKAGQHDRAAAMYVRLQEYLKAGENFQKAGAFKMSAEMFEKLEQFEKAAESYRQAGLLRKAAEMYERAQMKVDAARMLEEAYYERAQRLSEGLTKDRVRTLLDMALTSANLYSGGDSTRAAAKMFEEGGLFSKAGELYTKLGEQDKASQLFLKVGESLKAAEALEKGGETKESSLIKAKAFLQKGQKIEAAALFERARDYLKAADLYHQLGEHLKAADMFEKGGDFLKAGSSYRSNGDLKKAAKCLESGKDFKGAAEIYSQLGDYQKEAELLSIVGEFYRVGERLRARGLNDQAIKTLQLVERTSPDYRKASLVLGDIFQEKGMWGLATEKYKEATGQDPMDRSNIGVFYSLAQVNEKSGDMRSALALYERIMSLDYHFRDVATRVIDVKKQLERYAASAATPTPAPAPAPPGVDPYAQTALGAHPPSPAVPLKKRYSIIEERGRGGLGIVYKAKDTVLDRVVALKVLHAAFQDNPKALESFIREAKAAASLNHPNVVTVFDAGQDDGDFFISMEFVDGSTLKELMQEQGKVPVKASILIAGQICRGLGYAHERKIVHRDIKPSNIMWTKKKVVKIMDFGLAKAMEEARREHTIVGGTPYYMSPEQTLGETVDHRSDVYSLGVTLFEIVSGKLPFTGGDVGYHHVHTPAPDPRSINPDIPEAMAHSIMKCMEKDPARRYQSTKELFSDLKKFG